MHAPRDQRLRGHLRRQWPAVLADDPFVDARDLPRAARRAHPALRGRMEQIARRCRQGCNARLRVRALRPGRAPLAPADRFDGAMAGTMAAGMAARPPAAHCDHRDRSRGDAAALRKSSRELAVEIALVHHGVHRLYGFNGLVRHPLHQQLDLVVAVLPLVFLGMPFAVTVLLGLAMSVQLILQHSNVDYRLGPFRHVLAIGPTHRLHHVSWKDEGDVNFGLFSTMWDRLLGTFRASSQQLPAAGDIGLQDEPCYPQCYWAQLALPFRTAARGDARVSLERPQPLAGAPSTGLTPRE